MTEPNILQQLADARERMRITGYRPESVSLPQSAEKLLLKEGYKPIKEDAYSADWGEIQNMHIITRRLTE